MCCSLQVHVRAIAIICIVLTFLAAFPLFENLSSLDLGGEILGSRVTPWTTELKYNVAQFWVSIVTYVIHLLAYFLCLIGAYRRNKYMLIPFLVVTAIEILLWTGGVIYLIYVLASGVEPSYRALPSSFGDTRDEIVAIGGLFLYLAIVGLLIPLGILSYFFVIVAKFYNEISSGIISGQREGVVLQAYNPPQMAQQGGGGVATIYVPPNVPYQYPQQAPPVMQNVAYQHPQQPPYNPYIQQAHQPGASYQCPQQGASNPYAQQGHNTGI